MIVMTHCTKCGRALGDKDKFCPKCGEKVNRKAGIAAEKQSPGAAQSQNSTQRPAEPVVADPNSVQYVYVSKKTGRITRNPHVKTRSEGCFQFFGIALAAVALVILMVAGSVFLSGYLSEGMGVTESGEDYPSFTSADTEISSWSRPEEVSSQPVSSETVSSAPVSSEPTIPEEQTAKYMQKKITGKWSTDIPYKNMKLPGTFEFDGKGKCKCTIRAFLFSKKFDGTYKIKDGGECSLTLNGLEEYFDDDTMVGTLKFVTDDQIEFTVSDTVWKLNRVE